MAEEKRLLVEDRRYAILTKDSVRVVAEAAGHADLSDSTAALLGEDVSYRLREVTQKSGQFMRHAKRRRLNADDFNKALKYSDLQPVFGHRSMEPPPAFRPTRDGEIYFNEDPEVNFPATALSSCVPKANGQTTIKAHWLAIEGIQKTSTATQNPQGKPVPTKHEVTDVLMKYYDKVTQAILGFDEEIMKTALVDLRTNCRIVPLLPHFVNFISNGVKTVSHDVRQLTKLLYTVKSLVSNTALFLEPQPYLVMLVQGVTYCLLETLAASINPNNDHWSLRDYAARLLSLIVSIWGNSVNHLERFTEKTLREVLYDHSKPFCCHYGAVIGLQALGSQNIERVLLPHLSLYWPHLTKAMEDMSTDNALMKSDAHKVYCAILQSVEFILSKRIKDFKEISKQTAANEKNKEEAFTALRIKQEKKRKSNVSGFLSMFDKSPAGLYSEMYEYFGDSLAMRLPDMRELKLNVFKPKVREIEVSLADPEAQKSGEELLGELMEEVKKQEEIDRKRREQEKIEKEKREREEKERLESKKIDYERRLAEHRQRQLLQQLAYQKQQQQKTTTTTPSDEDEDVDVEGDVKSDKSDNSPRSEKSEEEQFAPQGAEGVSLAVKSTVSGPGQGIKLTITKRPTMKLNIKPVEPPQQQLKDKREAKYSRKRKQSLRSPKEIDYCELDEEDEVASYDTKPSYTTHSIYSSEGEGSSDGSSIRKPLTLKIKKKETLSD